MGISNDRVDVVYIGGGPSSLPCAIHAKLLKPDINIVIYEKYEKYQRDHVIQLERSAFDTFSQDARVQKIVQGFFKVELNGFTTWLQGTLGSWFSNFLPEIANVPTSEIELAFKKLAVDLGIEFRYEAIDRPRDLLKRFPNLKVLIGADGSHSETRKQLISDVKYITEKELNVLLPLLQQRDPSVSRELLIKLAKEEKIEIRPKGGVVETTHSLFESIAEKYKSNSIDDFLSILLNKMSHEEVVNQEDLQYIAELKYQVVGKAIASDTLLEGYPTEKLVNAIVHEHIGRERNGATPITVLTFIDKHTFEVLKDKATFRNPLAIDDPLIPPNLKNVFETWLRLREKKLSYKYHSWKMRYTAEDAENPLNRKNLKITVTHLQMYRSKTFIKEINHCMIALLGDAAAGVPFRKGYNGIALPCAVELAKAVVATCQPENNENIPSLSERKTRQLPLQDYASFAAERVRVEFLNAKLKNTAIEAYKWWIDLSRLVPWQMILANDAS